MDHHRLAHSRHILLRPLYFHAIWRLAHLSTSYHQQGSGPASRFHLLLTGIKPDRLGDLAFIFLSLLFFSLLVHHGPENPNRASV